MKRKLALLTAMAVIFLVVGAGYIAIKASSGNQEGLFPGGFPLARPAIAQTASFLDDEAGMSAYTNTGFAINLNSARNAFRTVERETADWIVGSVAVPGYTEEEDAHVFVHRDGWIVAYYERGSPVARTVHWATAATTLGTHKLQQALTQVSGSAGVPVPSVGYFNFQYPNATEWLVIVDNDSFSLNIPSEFVVFERSFSVRRTGSCCGRGLDIDGGRIFTWDDLAVHYGQIDLTPDASHLFALVGAADVAVSLLYLPPQ